MHCAYIFLRNLKTAIPQLEGITRQITTGWQFTWQTNGSVQVDRKITLQSGLPTLKLVLSYFPFQLLGSRRHIQAAEKLEHFSAMAKGVLPKPFLENFPAPNITCFSGWVWNTRKTNAFFSCNRVVLKRFTVAALRGPATSNCLEPPNGYFPHQRCI